ncbi:MAG: hypothetical protein ACK5L3_12205 [Oscillospiraceae bacterium]
MSWQPPIFDRTQADVDARNAKAYLDILDYDRIEGNTAHLATEFGLQLATRSWALDDMPTPSEFTRLGSNLAQLISAYHVLPSTPTVPQNPINTFSKVNDLEKILWVLYTLWTENQKNILYAGEGYAGESIGVI